MCFFFLFIQVEERGTGRLKRDRISTGESFITHGARCADMEIYSQYCHNTEMYPPFNLVDTTTVSYFA